MIVDPLEDAERIARHRRRIEVARCVRIFHESVAVAIRAGATLGGSLDFIDLPVDPELRAEVVAAVLAQRASR